MTPDVIGTIISAFSGLALLFGGIAVLIRRSEARTDEKFANMSMLMTEKFARVDALFEQVDARFEQVDARFEKVDEQFAKAGEQFAKISTELREVRDDINRVNVAVARLEGPPRHLIAR